MCLENVMDYCSGLLEVKQGDMVHKRKKRGVERERKQSLLDLIIRNSSRATKGISN